MGDVSDSDRGSTTATAPPPPPPPAPPGTATPAPQGGSGRGGRGGRAWFGIVLIVLGLLFLAERFVPGVNWVNLWPLVIIAAGLIAALTPGSEGWSLPKMFDGLVTVAFGLVFLAITLGYVGWGVWVRILSFWPVLLISIGIDILAKTTKQNWLRIFGSLLVIAALAYSVISYPVSGSGTVWGSRPRASDPVDISAPIEGVTEGKLTLDGGVADIDVGTGTDDLIAITGDSPWGDPRMKVERVGSVASVKATLGDDEPDLMWPDGAEPHFDVSLSEEVLWDVRMNTGVADVDIDLSEAQVRNFDLRPGVADCDVRLGYVPDGIDRANAQVRSGVSSVVLRIPDDAEARVQIEAGLSGTNVSGGFEQAGDGVWETPGYDDAKANGEPVWLIIVRSGVGAVTIDTY